MIGDKKVYFPLAGEDGNAFAILGRFQKAARRAGWSSDEVKEVRDKAMSGDYDHLLQVMIKVQALDEEGDEDGLEEDENENSDNKCS